MSFLRGSANYVWYTTSVLGKGTTGAVFQAVHKPSKLLIDQVICAPRMFRCEILSLSRLNADVTPYPRLRGSKRGRGKTQGNGMTCVYASPHSATSRAIFKRDERFYGNSIRTMPDLVLYYDEISPPVRAVLMTYRVLGIELTLQKCDLFKRENRTPEFIKMNPLHTVPVLKDGEANITDSHAIMCYLADKYGTTNNTLFPKDLLERATVMERLFFECGVLFKYDADLMYGIFFNGITEVPADKMANILEAYSYLEIYLAESEWLAGPNMTLADLSCVATLSTLDIVVPVSSNFPRLESWLRRFQKLPFYECNQDGVNKMRAILLSKGFK